VIQKAWHEEQRPVIHGWVYSMGDGFLKSLYKVEPGAQMHEIFQFDF
jgi:carbonic anhydrase